MTDLTTISTSWCRLTGTGWLASALLLGGCGPIPVDPQPAQRCIESPGAICTVVGIGGPDQRGFNGDGNPAHETLLYFPTDLAFDEAGRMVFVDFNNQRIRRVEHDDTVQTLAGSGMHAYATPGLPAVETGFENPVDLILLPDERMLVAELHAGRVLEIDANGIVQTYAGSGIIGNDAHEVPAHLAELSEFYGVALGDDGTLYIGDTENHCIRAVSAEPVPIDGYDYEARLITNLAGHAEPGFVDGATVESLFDRPYHMAFHEGSLYIADAGNHAIRRIDLASGTVETIVGTGLRGYAGDGGDALEAQLDNPSGVAVDDDGTLFIADRGNHVVRVVHPDGIIETLAGIYQIDGMGIPMGGWSGDGGPAVEAHLDTPENVVIGPDGHLYVADTLNGAIRVIYRESR